MTSSSPFRRKRGSSDGRGSSSGSGNRGRILPPIFTEGDTLADRYRIVRFLGRGGMGEVYEAEDLDLDVRVALKTVRPEIADHDVALERFRREIQLARKVTHPNVCRIFDVGHHHLEATDAQEEREIVFLTMEHLEGPTLGEHLRVQGRLSEEEAFPIVEQMAAAIDAAHQVGIVHRDFKSSNVILTDDPGYPGGKRAVVTDFGLARGILPGDSLTTSLSSSSQALGTPTYMAPEQVAGSTVTPAVDIYALGIVVYEMMTGRPPFQSRSPLTTAVKRLTEAPPPPRALAPDLGTRWESGILKCLERDPSARFTEARHLPQWIRGDFTSVPGAYRWLSSTWRVYAAVLSLALILAIAGTFWLSKRESPVGQRMTSSAVNRPLVAVIGFRNLTGDPDAEWLGTALQEMLSMELAASEEVRVVSGDTVARVRQELGLNDFQSLTTDQINRFARNLDTDLVLIGSFFIEGSSEDPAIRLDVRAHRTGAEEVISPVIETGRRSSLLSLVSATGEKLRAKLGFDGQAVDTTTALVASYPVDPDATMAYAHGLEALRRGDPIAARSALDRSIELEPRNPLAYSALASAWSSLGYDHKAREAARSAMELSRGLPREERLLIEARYYESASEWNEAVKTYTRLTEIASDNVEYRLALARAQASAGDSSALDTIEAIRRLEPGSTDPRIPLAEAQAAEALGDFERERDAARVAAARAAELEAWVLLARARLAEWWAERNMGNLEQASKVSSEALEVARRAGDRSLTARALNAIATTKRQLGQIKEARELDLESLRVFREIGDKRRESWALNNLGRANFETGSFDQALDYYQQSLEIAREIDDVAGVSRALGNIGNLYFEQRRLSESEAVFRQTIQMARQIGDRRSLPWAQANLGGTLADRGQLENAGRLLEEAITGFRQTGEKRGEAWALRRRGELHLYENDREAAERDIRDAMQIFLEIGDQRGTYLSEMHLAEALLALGEIDRAETLLTNALDSARSSEDRFGEAFNDYLRSKAAAARDDPSRATELARSAARRFETLNLPQRQAIALVSVARSELTEGNVANARRSLDRARSLVKNDDDPRLALRLRIVGQQIRGTVGTTAGALDQLEKARNDALELGYADLASQADEAIAVLRDT